MNKKTKMWLGVGVVAAAAYYFWHKSQTTSTTPAVTKSMASADGIFMNQEGTSQCGSVPCRKGEVAEGGFSGGEVLCRKPNGAYICRNKYNK